MNSKNRAFFDSNFASKNSAARKITNYLVARVIRISLQLALTRITSLEQFHKWFARFSFVTCNERIDSIQIFYSFANLFFLTHATTPIKNRLDELFLCPHKSSRDSREARATSIYSGINLYAVSSFYPSSLLASLGSLWPFLFRVLPFSLPQVFAGGPNPKN